MSPATGAMREGEVMSMRIVRLLAIVLVLPAALIAQAGGVPQGATPAGRGAAPAPQGGAGRG
ncbi:MAG TPA: hypothetical protein VJP86_00405, partial [Vicinamibacterales bacterium]|nr:hypothetical protein [Vicinamibacterales bacterium]